MIRTTVAIALAALGALLFLPLHASADTSTALAQALEGKVKTVVPSDKIAIGVLTQDGHYAATTVDGLELGLFYKRNAWRFAESPYFAIDLTDEKNNLVIVPDNNALKTEKTPKDWLWTDYKREGRTNRSVAVPAGNLPRVLIVREAGRAYELDGGFVESKSLMRNAVSVVLIWHDGERVHTASLGVNHARDEKEARALVAAMTALLPPSWPRK